MQPGAGERGISDEVKEAWQRYRSMGTEPPHVLGEAALTGFLEAIEPIRGTNKLKFMIGYELGQIHLGQPQRAADDFRMALDCLQRSHFSRLRPTESIAAHTFARLTRFMLARASEKNTKSLETIRQRTVQALGNNIKAFDFTPHGDREKRFAFGKLVEQAFVGTYLTLTEPFMIGASTTDRQDWHLSSPAPDLPENGQDTAAIEMSNPSSDINLYTLPDTSGPPVMFGRVQIKTNFPEDTEKDEAKREELLQKHPAEALHYDPDVTVMFANRELYVGGVRELREYADELARYDGTPSPWLRVAADNIMTELQERDRHFYPWPAGAAA